MKKSIYIMIFLLITAGQTTMAQKTSAEEVATPELVVKREQLKKEVVTNYMAVKQCLIVSDSVNTAKEAAKFIASLDKFKFKKLTLMDMNAATNLRKEIKELALVISKTNDINKQRKAFSALSTKMWTMGAKVKAQNVVLYQQVCPMTGDTWMSLEKEIKNPYYPKNMLTCGEIKQRI